MCSLPVKLQNRGVINREIHKIHEIKAKKPEGSTKYCKEVLVKVGRCF